jgi:hypothetical protein
MARTIKTLFNFHSRVTPAPPKNREANAAMAKARAAERFSTRDSIG